MEVDGIYIGDVAEVAEGYTYNYEIHSNDDKVLYSSTTSNEVEDKAKERKGMPVYSGVLRYFPLAFKEIAKCSQVGNDQHNPGKPLHWDRAKSGDELDAMMRHLIDHASGELFDDCGTRHIVKCGWRILAFIQKTIENEEQKKM